MAFSSIYPLPEISSAVFAGVFNHPLIGEKARGMKYKPNEIIYKASMPVTSVVFIKKGLVKIFENTMGKENILQLATKNEFLHISEIFDQKVYSHTACTLETTEVVLIEKIFFLEAFRSNNYFAECTVKLMKQGEVNYYRKRLSDDKNPPMNKVVLLLLFLADKVYEKQSFPLALNRIEIANFLHLSVKSVNRVFNTLMDEEYIHLEGRNIKILNKRLLLANLNSIDG